MIRLPTIKQMQAKEHPPMPLPVQRTGQIESPNTGTGDVILPAQKTK